VEAASVLGSQRDRSWTSESDYATGGGAMPQPLLGYIERNYLLMQIVRFAPIDAVERGRATSPNRTYH
jgi:hypothetical protein